MHDIIAKQDFVQEYAETIADVLEIDVTIVNEDCIRIAGTGPHASNVGKPVPHGSFFRKVLKTGEPGFIFDKTTNAECRSCATIAACRELATMGFPLRKRGRPVGVIGIIAFNPQQKNKLMTATTKLLSFLNHMSSLLESKFIMLEANQRLQCQVQEAMQAVNRTYSFGTMIGRDRNFVNLLHKAQQVSNSISTVLIRGESGTGKELLARATHSESERKKQPFIVVNCPSIPENLLESELFGYEAGAFTGASKRGKIGKFELAHQGTIFLDEIGDLPLSLQPKLLRTIQEKVIERVGGSGPVPVDVRVVAATNRDLESMVRDGAFREDLYYRLNVIPLFIPPLRERKDDIGLYLEYFLQKYGNLLQKEKLKIDLALIHWLKSYHWPGNVRQLENVVEYMVNMVRSDTVGVRELPYYLSHSEEVEHVGLGLDEQIAEYEKSILMSYLKPESSVDDKMQIAKQLKISLATLYRKMGRHNLQ